MGPGKLAGMTDSPAGPSRWQGKTLWARDRSAPLGAFLRTESGSAVILVAAVVVALVWANVNASSYESVWHTKFSLRLGRSGSPTTCRPGSTAA